MEKLNNDFTLNENHLMQLIKFYQRDIGLINHQIQSFNDLVKPGGGIENILEKFFRQKQELSIESSNQYSYVELEMIFSNVQFKKPYIHVRSEDIKSSTVKEKPLTPSMVRKQRDNYEAEMLFDITINLTPYQVFNKDGIIIPSSKIKTEGGKEVKLQTEVHTRKNVLIASIPIMVKSQLCNLYQKNAIELLNLYEDDPTDPGGYFIVKGHEYIIASTESVLYNFLHIRDMGKKYNMIKGMIISREDESGFGNSYQTNFHLYDNNIFTIQITNTSFSPVEIPLQIFFRMLGVCTDKQILEYILYDPEDKSRFSNEIWNVLKEVLYKVNKDFEEIKDVRNQDTILEFVGRLLTKKKADQMKTSAEGFMQYNNTVYENTAKLKAFVLNLYNQQYLSQFAGQNQIHEKLLYTGIVVRQLISKRLGIVSQTDRDSLKTKRIISPGVQFAKELKTVISSYLVGPLRQRLQEMVNQQDFNPGKIDIDEIIRKSIASSDINKIIKQSLTTGEDKIITKRKSVPNRISSQEQLRKNNIYTLSSLRTIQSSEGKVGSQNERAAELRQVHPSFIGYICPCQTPETGRRIGINKQMSVWSDITGAIDSKSLYEYIRNDKNIVQTKELQLWKIIHQKLTPVSINGAIWGYTDEQPFNLRQRYVELRRQGKIHSHITIQVDMLSGIIEFWTDGGRLIRPLLIAYTNEQGIQQTKLTKQILNDLTTGKLNFHDLIKMQVMEYISSGEQENCLISENITELYNNNKIQKEQEKYTDSNLELGDIYSVKKYTHIEIPQSIFGLVALIDPLFNHSQPQRCTMLTNQAKQANGWASLDYPFRYNKMYYLQHVCEMPLVKTIANDISLPGGQNVVLAILMSDGYNQLDSMIINRASVERGLLACTYYTHEVTELEAGEFIALPNDQTQGIKQDADYSKLDTNGIIKKGTLVTKGDVLISKKTKITNKEEKDGMLYIDNSITYSEQEKFLVDDIVVRDDTDKNFALIRFKSYRQIEQGDKFSSRVGCKGTIGEVKDVWDMPYTKDGIIPDILMNPTAVPTRMIVGQLLEMLIARCMNIKGSTFDGSVFQKFDLEEFIKYLEEEKQSYSEETLYNGKTGEKMKAKVFMGPCFMQRLQKFAATEFYVTSGGQRNSTTRQPLEGRNSQGGIRMGEMETNCIIAHGATQFLREKFYKDSDGYDSYVCKTCGKGDVIFNADKYIYHCEVCQQNTEIVKVPSFWSNNVYFKELESMGVGMKLNIKPKEYYIQ